MAFVADGPSEGAIQFFITLPDIHFWNTGAIGTDNVIIAGGFTIGSEKITRLPSPMDGKVTYQTASISISVPTPAALKDLIIELFHTLTN